MHDQTSACFFDMLLWEGNSCFGPEMVRIWWRCQWGTHSNKPRAITRYLLFLQESFWHRIPGTVCVHYEELARAEDVKSHRYSVVVGPHGCYSFCVKIWILDGVGVIFLLVGKLHDICIITELLDFWKNPTFIVSCLVISEISVISLDVLRNKREKYTCCNTHLNVEIALNLFFFVSTCTKCMHCTFVYFHMDVKCIYYVNLYYI